MDGGNGGAAVRVEATAGAQGSAEQEAAARIADGEAGGAVGDVGRAGDTSGSAGNGSAADGTGAAEKARADYEKALAERDKRIAELEGEIAEAARTAESAERLRAEMDELRRQGDVQRVSFELQLAEARNVKAATALLREYDNDVAALKAAEPWLFADAAPRQAGKTGLPNAGAATDEGKTLKRWRSIAGLDEKDGE